MQVNRIMHEFIRIEETITPFEAFATHNPELATDLQSTIILLADCSHERAGWILQEVCNALHRTARQRMKDLGYE